MAEVSFIQRHDPASGMVNPVNLPDNAVFDNFDYDIEDLGSVNGTWLHDHNLKKANPIRAVPR
jgi:hypothetical protein